MRFCKPKVDLSICGLLITTTLFFFPGLIFLVLGFSCVEQSGKNTSDKEMTSQSGSCAMVDQKTIITLFSFGFVFLIVGILVCVFAFIVHRANCEQKRQEATC